MADGVLVHDFERLVYGDGYSKGEAESRRTFSIFLVLNLLMSDWYAYKEGMITLAEFRESAVMTLNLLARQRELVVYLVENRGYPPEFAFEVKAALQKAVPVPLCEVPIDGIR